MTKRFYSLVLSLVLLWTLCFIPKASYAAYADVSIDQMSQSYNNSGMLYGPPLPQNIPLLASRSGELLHPHTKTASASNDNINYVVKSGDSLYDIAAAFNTKVQTLAQMNNIADTNVLHIGQELKVPNIALSISQNYEIDQVLDANLTAYTSGPESTGKNPGDPGYGITATGNHVRDQYTIAVDPSVIPLGSKVYIEGIGIRVADDTGGAIQGNRIDVYMSDLDSALNFGYKKNVKVYLLHDKSQRPNSSLGSNA